MKKNIKNIFIFVLFTSLLMSCESTNLELQDNPLALTPDNANPDFILNAMLLGSGSQHVVLSAITDGVVRHINQFGTYTNSISGLTATTMNSPWALTYQLMGNMQLLKDLADRDDLPHHLGMAKILNAFQLVNLVDYLGTATYSEAANPNEFPAPGLDSGESIYAAMFSLLEEGIADLNKTASYTHNDGFYNGNIVSWKKLANSLIIRMYVQSRKATNFNASEAAQKINAIVNSGIYISSITDDFQIVFTGNIDNPDTRHPFFLQNYLGAAGTYMSNDFMDKLLFDKSIEDPRLRHYIYRQTSDAPVDDFIDDCLGSNIGSTACYVGNGYWGRIHADESGVPNDGEFRATYGMYPGGGAFDNGDFISVGPLSEQESGKNGEGLHPIITSSLIKFLLAEAVLFIPGVNGDASTLLDEAIQDSFDKVSNFTGEAMTTVNTYKTEVNTNFINANNNEDKLAIIIDESHIATFGESIDAYNAYRRTGYPNFSESFQAPGAFPRSMFLPNSELIANDNPDFVQKQLIDQVFWDTNPAGFIK